MKTSSLVHTALVGSLAASQMSKTEAIVSPFFKGVVTGIENEVFLEQLNRILPKNNAPAASAEALPCSWVRRVSENIAETTPKAFVANAAANYLTTRLLGGTHHQGLKVVDRLPAPVAMGVTAKALASQTPMPNAMQRMVGYGTFLATRLIGGDKPATTSLAVAGFVAATEYMRSSKRLPSMPSVLSSIGFIPPNIKDFDDKAISENPKAVDEYLASTGRAGKIRHCDGSLDMPLSGNGYGRG